MRETFHGRGGKRVHLFVLPTFQSLCAGLYTILLLHMCSQPARWMTFSSLSLYAEQARTVRPVPTWSSSVSPTCRLIRSDVGSSRNGSLPSPLLPSSSAVSVQKEPTFSGCLDRARPSSQGEKLSSDTEERATDRSSLIAA